MPKRSVSRKSSKPARKRKTEVQRFRAFVNKLIREREQMHVKAFLQPPRPRAR